MKYKYVRTIDNVMEERMYSPRLFYLKNRKNGLYVRDYLLTEQKTSADKFSYVDLEMSEIGTLYPYLEDYMTCNDEIEMRDIVIELPNGEILEWNEKNVKKLKNIHDKNFVKDSNNIEELCDAYVIVPKDGKSKPLIEISLSVFDDFEDVLKHNDIYLSIWVDALLKPIAKINDKGEPKLL